MSTQKQPSSRLSFEEIASYIAECDSLDGRRQKALRFEKAIGMSAKKLLAEAESIRARLAREARP